MVEKRERLLPIFFMSLGILLLSLGATFCSWKYNQHNSYQHSKIQFENYAKEIEDLIRDRLEAYTDALYGAKGLFAASQAVERDEWHAYATSVNIEGRYPGIAALTYIERIGKKSKTAFVNGVRADLSLSPTGHPDFDIFPKSDRQEYFVVKYLEPFESNKKAFGFDVGSDPTRYQALEMARDTGLPALTSRIALVTDRGNYPGASIYLPIYRNGASLETVKEKQAALIGFVSAVFRTDKLFSGLFSKRAISPDIDFEIFDGDELVSEHLLYDEKPEKLEVAQKNGNGFDKIATLAVGGQAWKLHFSGKPEFGLSPNQKLFSLMIVLAGVIFSFFLAGIFYQLAISRYQAEQLAEKRTMDLRREVTERRRAEQAIQKNLEQVMSQQTALVALTQRVAIETQNATALLQQITESAAKAMKVDRVSIWRCTEDRSAIHCVDLYELSKTNHSSGMLLAAKDYPRYFSALEELNIIVAEDAHRHIYTSEFSKDYLSPLGISSMMDAPIRLYGTSAGVICYEHVGPMRHWTPDEQLFAVSLGNLISLVLEQEEHRQAEESLRESQSFLDSIVENLPNMVFVKEAKELRFVRLNKAGEDLIGFSRSEIIGKNDYDFFPKAEADFFTDKDREVLAGGEAVDIPEEPIHTKDKGIRYLHTKKVPILDEKGRPVYLLGISEDITERLQANEVLLQKTEELARTQAERQQLELFNYMASHDMQEPLQKIIAFSDILQARYQDALKDEGKEYLNRMAKSAARMSQLLDDLLQFSRVKKKDEMLQSIDLEKIIDSVLSDIEMRLKASGGKVEVKKLPTVKADPAQMNQLFQNLIINAIKFSKKDVPPRIVISSRALNQRSAEIIVEDNGIGFDEKYKGQIFKPFERLHGRGEYEGSGIGLAICEKIVLQHGGKITVTSELGKGSTFIITLPLL